MNAIDHRLFPSAALVTPCLLLALTHLQFTIAERLLWLCNWTADNHQLYSRFQLECPEAGMPQSIAGTVLD